MMIPQEDGTVLASPADMMCILWDVQANRYHVAFFEESPMPGPIKPLQELEFIRLKSKMHHTTGAETLEGAKTHMVEMRKKLSILDTSVLEEPIEWDGRIGLVFMAANWLRDKRSIQKADLLC